MELNDFLLRLKELGGSDMHLTAGLPPAMRVFDELLRLRDMQKPTPEQMREMIYPLLSPEEIMRFESDPDVRFELDFARGIPELGRFRFNLHRQRGSLAVTIRALPTEVPSLASLSLPEAITDFVWVRRGLLLLTGAARSGLSTTLAALVNEVNSQRPARIMTIEDPVEYIIQSEQAWVTQREVGDGADTVSLENALRHARRQDLDVLMISNLTRYETMRLALELAETGLFVIAGMPTTSVIQTLTRMIESFPAEQRAQIFALLSANLVGVLSQVLLPRKNRKGRVAACEVMKVNALIRSEIRSGKLQNLHTIIQSDTSGDNQTMDAALIDLARQGMIDYVSAKPYIRDEASHRMIHQLSGGLREGAPGSGATDAYPNGLRSGRPPSSAADSTSRRRLGTTVIPPWEKKK
jgi:twitching motility protein PilT